MDALRAMKRAANSLTDRGAIFRNGTATKVTFNDGNNNIYTGQVQVDHRNNIPLIPYKFIK